MVDIGDLERWRKDPASFIEECLFNPETGEPFELFDAEREFLKHSFQLDASGRLLYPEQVYSGPKKTGKTLGLRSISAHSSSLTKFFNRRRIIRSTSKLTSSKQF
jgi:hypothetical protein